MGGKFRVIYADPPWRFKTYSDKGRGRCADAHYDVLSLNDLARLPVSEKAEDNCVLLMWTVDPLLPQALGLVEDWGFKFKTIAFYWAKLNKNATSREFDERSFFTGLGYWTRANPEMCLLATRGSPKRMSRDVKRLIVAPRREHSRKPDEVYERIERLLEGPYLEMFARTTRRGWTAWGTQIGLFDNGPVATRRWPSIQRSTMP